MSELDYSESWATLEEQLDLAASDSSVDFGSSMAVVS